ncbi:MAG: DUF1990 family protein [Isosphaeraceae bacterium]
MMISLRRPAGERIRAFLAAQSGLSLTYEAVGATATVPPERYAVDHTRVKLGEGEEVFMRAKAALGRWVQFRLGWLEAWPSRATIEAGDLVAVVAHRFGLWWLNACRIVYVVDEPGSVSRFGFAYGTLPDHAGTGEERFLVEWDRATGEVWYDILAFSRPNLVLTRLGYPYMRRLQRRFGKESAAAMLRAVAGSMGGASNREERR